MRRLLIIASAVAASVALAACGGDETKTVTVTTSEVPIETGNLDNPSAAVKSPTGEAGVVKSSEAELSLEQGDDQRPALFFDQAQPGTVTTYAVQDVLSFSQTAGNPQWQQSALNRVRSGVWAFYGDGTAFFDTVDVRRDVYPLRGGFQVSGSRATFSVSGSVQNGYSGFSVSQMDGSIDYSVNPPTMDFTWRTDNGSAAVINGTSFGGGSASGYQARVSLRQG